MEEAPLTIRKLYLNELCFPSWTVQQRLQVFLKRASFLASSTDGPVLSVHNLGDSHVYQFFFLVFYERLCIFFFSTYLWSGRQDFRHASSAHCHHEISDLEAMFLNNMDLESKQKFSLGYYNWMLILIHCNPRRLVFLVLLVQTVAYPLQTPGVGNRPIFGHRWATHQTLKLLLDALTFAWISLNIWYPFAY